MNINELLVLETNVVFKENAHINLVCHERPVAYFADTD